MFSINVPIPISMPGTTKSAPCRVLSLEFIYSNAIVTYFDFRSLVFFWMKYELIFSNWAAYITTAA